MVNKLIKQSIYIIFLIIIIPLASAANITIDELIDSYNYDFYDETINVTIFDDYMIDQDSSGLNDTLIINLTTDTSNTATYLFIVSLNEKTDLIQNYTNKTISTSDLSAQVSFDTKKLNLNQYNYSVEIRRQDYSLAYMKYRTQTNYYSNYEQGISVISTSDQSITNNLIRITLSLNVTENKTANITAYLKYNNKTISATKEETLTTPSQSVNIDFDNETIKSTHYNGIYSLESVKIGDKIIDIDYNTSSYNYEDFSKTSYIKTITSGTFDNNSNNLSEALQFNFTLNITSSDTYTVEAALYDSSDNYITIIAKNETLNIGTQIVKTEVVGEDIYSTYYNGKFKLSFVKLSIGNDTEDIIYDAHTTNITYYTDFERPPLPDLVIAMNIIFNGTTNNTNITVNISNLGEAPAFNVFLDIFDNVSYTDNESTAFLSVNESKIYYFNLSNSTNNTLYTAIVDFDNLVDESNESNNIVQNVEVVSSITITSLTDLTPNNLTKIFEFIILNNGDTTLNNINWSIDFGDGNTAESLYKFNLSNSENIFVFVEHSYTDNQSRTVTAYAYAENLSASKSITIGETALQITSFSELYSMGREKVWEFIIKNNLNENLTNINWNITGTDAPISSTYPFNLTPNETIRVYVHENLTNYQDYTITAKAFTDTLSDTETLSTRGKEIEVSDIKTLYTTGLTKIFEFLVTNTYTSTINDINWSFYTGESTINSIYLFNLTSWENIRVLIENQYSGSGNYNINASVKSSQYKDSENKTITV